MELKDFLNRVITASEPGYFCLAVSNGGGVWLETWYRWPDDIDKIVAHAERDRTHANVYFSSYLFKAPQSTKENIIKSRTIQADLDDADLKTLPKEAAVVVQTSPGRHQAYWILKEVVGLDEHEDLSRRLTYSIPMCDRSGWPLGRKVRLPGTYNYKYLDGAKPISVISSLSVEYNYEDFEGLPEVPKFLIDAYDVDFVENPGGSDKHPLELLEDIRTKIPAKTYVQYGMRQEDRSEALWSLLCSALKAGLTRAETFTLAKGSANNKFDALRSRGDQALAKDVLRAEFAINTNVQDPRVLIRNIVRTDLTIQDKKRQILDVVLEAMKRGGEFISTYSGTYWYVRRDIGRPIVIGARSERLESMLDSWFGLNSSEQETHYVVAGLRAHVANIPENASIGTLSSYLVKEQKLLIHTGRRDVLILSKDGVTKGINGCHGIMFPWSQINVPFTPVTGSKPVDWGDELFGNGTRGAGSSVNNVTNMTSAQAMAILKVWTLFIILRDAAGTRPILASLGQPGSGKTTLFKKVYAILYGRRKSIGSVTTREDFDHSTAQDPLVVFDNVDTWESWLPDRLAVSAGVSDVTKRKLWTDSDTVTIRRQAIIGVTAHNPKFGREDVADRFLLINFKRLEEFVSEELIMADLMDKRNNIWGGIVDDLCKVLRTPIPVRGPQFRIEDFARYGLWIAKALNIEQEFIDAIGDVKSSQQAFVLEEEGMLVNALTNMADDVKDPNKWMTSPQLWASLEIYTDDKPSFVKVYRNSVMLSKKLMAMQAALRRIFTIETKPGPGGIRMWRIINKETTE